LAGKSIPSNDPADYAAAFLESAHCSNEQDATGIAVEVERSVVRSGLRPCELDRIMTTFFFIPRGWDAYHRVADPFSASFQEKDDVSRRKQ
jgi:hypothetical protein